MLGYPAVQDELKLTRGKAAQFMYVALVFAGPLMVTISWSRRIERLRPNRPPISSPR
jgi:hypothetical protein